MLSEKVGEAYFDLHYRMDGLAKDLRVAKTTVVNQVDQLKRDVDNKTQGMFGKVSEQLGGMGAAVGALRNLVVAGFAVQMVQAVGTFAARVAQTGSDFTRMRAQIEQNLGPGAFDAVINSANRLGVGIKDAADATARFGMAAQDIGLSRDEVIKLTETVIRLGRIGNSSGQEMAAGMYQLSQSLASGKFQGDELRSVLEQMPEVARTLARELGVSIGKLREMGSEGELTASVVSRALLAAADDARERFEKLPDTLEQGQARWSNAVDQMFAALDKAWHASPAAQWLLKFGSSFAEGLTVDLGGGDQATQMRVLQERLEKARQFNWLGSNQAQIEQLEQQLKAVTMFSRMAGDGSHGDAGGPAKFSGPSAWSLYGTPTLEDAKAMKGYRDDAAQIAKEAQAEQERLNQKAETEAERHKAAMARLEDARREDLRRDIEATVKEEEDRLQKVKETNEKLARVNQETRRNELEAERRKRQHDIETDPAGYYARTHDAELAPIYDASTGAQDTLKELAGQSQQYGRMIGDGIKAGADTAAQALTNFSLTGRANLKELLKSFGEIALNQAFRMMIGSALGAAGNYFFGAPGAQQGGATGDHAGLAGFARGGVFDRGSVVPLARGGVVSSAHLIPLARGSALIGEAGPEAVMPLGRDSSGRLGVRGGGGGGTNVTIIDQRGHGAPAAEVQKTPNDSGGLDISVIIRAEVQKAIGGGHADRAMRERFAMQPAVRR